MRTKNKNQFRVLKSCPCINSFSVPKSHTRLQKECRHSWHWTLSTEEIHLCCFWFCEPAARHTHCGVNRVRTADLLHLGGGPSLPWKEGLYQFVIFPSLGIKVTVQTWVIQKSQHFLVLFHAQFLFTCRKGNHRHVSYWPGLKLLNIRMAEKQESPSIPGEFMWAKCWRWNEGALQTWWDYAV